MAIISLPGLIDPHVHLRDPGQTHKEDFYTGTSAALAGGFTTIIDMPNNATPITTLEILTHKSEVAKSKIVCDLGFYFGCVGEQKSDQRPFGSLGDNIEQFERVKDFVFGLKLYLNTTTGNYTIDNKTLDRIFESWNYSSPILVHAEEEMVDNVILQVRRTGQSTHICHIASKNDLEKIIKAKEDNLPITCGVTPHHLFLTDMDVSSLGPYAIMKPPLTSIQNVEFLWSKLNYIDVIESDHAPHTREEKQEEKPPFGVPGLETTLPLLLTAYNNDRLTIEDIKRLCYENPKKIFRVPTDESCRIDIDTDAVHMIDSKYLHTKCKWTPFDGWEAKGKVERVFLRGLLVYENGNILAEQGVGKILQPTG